MVLQAPYELIRKINKVEIRQYPQLLMAQVDGLRARVKI